jgi:hypothetical protein
MKSICFLVVCLIATSSVAQLPNVGRDDDTRIAGPGGAGRSPAYDPRGKIVRRAMMPRRPYLADNLPESGMRNVH